MGGGDVSLLGHRPRNSADLGSSPDIGLGEMRDLLDICDLLYEPKTSVVVKLLYPRYWQVEHMGNVGVTPHTHDDGLLTVAQGKLKFTWTKRVRTAKLPPVRLAVPEPPRPPLLKKESSGPSGGPPRLIFKAKKVQPPAAAPALAPAKPTPAATKPKLTIKLKLPGQGGTGSG